jgi:dTDP-glucose 4,6-dehydratase
VTKVLVTGASGFVGSHVVEQLLTLTEFDVLALASYRNNGRFDRIIQAIDAVPNSTGRVEIRTWDLAAPFPCEFDETDYVINVASRCQVDASIREPEDFILNNVRAVLTPLELARRRPVRRFVQLLTDEIYGPHAPRSFTDHQPSSPYAASKAIQADAVHAYAHTFGVSSTVVTTSNMFGERQSTLAFLPRLVRDIRRGRTVSIHAVDGVPGVRNYTYVGNVARELVLELLTDDDVAAPYHELSLPGQVTLSNLDLAETVARLLDVELDYALVEATSVRPGYDLRYAASEPVDRHYHTSTDEAFNRTVAWLDSNVFCEEN